MRTLDEHTRTTGLSKDPATVAQSSLSAQNRPRGDGPDLFFQILANLALSPEPALALIRAPAPPPPTRREAYSEADTRAPNHDTAAEYAAAEEALGHDARGSYLAMLHVLDEGLALPRPAPAPVEPPAADAPEPEVRGPDRGSDDRGSGDGDDGDGPAMATISTAIHSYPGVDFPYFLIELHRPATIGGHYVAA